MRQQWLTNHTELLLPHEEVVEIPLSSIRSELLTDFCGYETLLEYSLHYVSNN